MACSRFKSRAGCCVFGNLRRSDFLPVCEESQDEVLYRGYESVSSEEDEGRGDEIAFADNEDLEYAHEMGNPLADFM